MPNGTDSEDPVLPLTEAVALAEDWRLEAAARAVPLSLLVLEDPDAYSTTIWERQVEAARTILAAADCAVAYGTCKHGPIEYHDDGLPYCPQCDAGPANDNAGPFSIGKDVWPGLAKLAEECGEVIQVIGKLIATGGRTDHWSGLDLRVALQDELADIAAASIFVIKHNPGLHAEVIDWRTQHKVAMFNQWHDGS